ncbi:hypothetical protein IC582_026151 [Cucumis melo]
MVGFVIAISVEIATGKGLLEVFYYAQKVVLHPRSTFLSRNSNSMPRCIWALIDIFCSY